MILDWKMGLIGLSLGALSACSGADESANIAPTPDASAASEIQAPANVISEPEVIVTAAEAIAPVVPASASETVAETTSSAADLTATADVAAAQLKVDATASVAAAAERAEAARIAAEQTAQTEARAATEARAQASRQAAEAEAAERARAAKAAQDAAVAAAIPADGIMASGTWTKKKRTSKGTWSITREGGELFVKLDDDFSTRSAPDLKIFLSPLSAAETRSSNAIDDALLISLLSSNKGAQSYKIPSGTDLADYSSILIHCENYTVLWSAADL